MRSGTTLIAALLVCSGCSGDVDEPSQPIASDAATAIGAGGTAGSAETPAGGRGGGRAGQGGTGRAGSGALPAGSGGAGVAGSAGSAGGAVDAGTEPDASLDPDAGNPPGDEPPAVRFVGRTDRREDGVVKLAWSGSGILFRFAGTEAAVRMDDPAGFWTVLIDGVEGQELATMAGERSYSLTGTASLPDGAHEIALYRRTEALFGPTRFFDVDVGDGELLPPPPPKSRQLEVIGDSITCGYGDEGDGPGCPFEAATENHWLSYGAITARDVGADLVTIAWSGKGILYNYGDDKNEPLPVLYPRALPADGSSQWDFAQWQPDVVVINLGTNDFSTDDDPSESAFEDAYRAFLVQLREDYPSAWIVCLVPTLLGGDDLTTAQTYITDVVNDRNEAGDDQVVVRSLAFTSEGAGCDYHPSLATHAAMAEALTAELRHLVGW